MAMLKAGSERNTGFHAYLAAFLLAMLLVLAFSTGDTELFGRNLEEKQREAERIRRQMDSMKAESKVIADEYNAILTAMERTSGELRQYEDDLSKTTQMLEDRKDVFNDRLRTMYKNGSMYSLEIFLGSTDMSDLLNRYEYMAKIGILDVSAMDEYEKMLNEIEDTRSLLSEAQAKQRSQADIAQQKRIELEASINAQDELLNSVNEEILSIIEEMIQIAPTPSPGSSGTVNITEFIFPVRGPNTFSNDWHAPRRGHLHQGNDIFAAMGTPCVACVTGTATKGEGGNAGLFIRLAGNDGNVYYYMHLQRFEATGYVQAGTIIGYVGDSGNARGGPPHLHFEIHPGGGPAVNPYPTLMRFNR